MGETETKVVRKFEDIPCTDVAEIVLAPTCRNG